MQAFYTQSLSSLIAPLKIPAVDQGTWVGVWHGWAVIQAVIYNNFNRFTQELSCILLFVDSAIGKQKAT